MTNTDVSDTFKYHIARGCTLSEMKDLVHSWVRSGAINPDQMHNLNVWMHKEFDKQYANIPIVP